MTVVDTTAKSQTETIAFDVDLRHAPAKVWRALTDPTLLAEWLLPAVGFTLAPGATFTFNAPPQPGWDGVVNCRVVDIEPQKKLTYRWVVGDLDTIVTFTLTPTASGTRLVIVQSGFKPDQKNNWGGARYGWRMMGGKLEDLLARIS
jgi:uncharacterized protein YndB with AHSA1/START domain